MLGVNVAPIYHSDRALNMKWLQFVMDTEIREIALEKNDKLSLEEYAIVGEWDILQWDKLVY